MGASVIRDDVALGATVDTWLERLGRRLMTLPMLFGLSAAYILLLPVLLAAALVVDVLRPRAWLWIRCLAFFGLYLFCEVAGVLLSLLLWLISGVWAGADRERFLHWNFALQVWWGTALYRGGAWIFDMHLQVDEPPDIARGPVIVFIRHLSTADTVLPVMLLSGPHGLRLRYVLKRELLWDPCLDIVGNRLPNYFVRRGSGDSAAEVAAVQQLMADLGPDEGVLIYPEGTRFTAAKRDRIVAKLAKGSDVQAYERARPLRNVLPPHLGGSLGLLERNAGADALFCVHVGLERAGSFWDFIDGSLIGCVIRVRFWRVPYAEIPTGREAQAVWLFDHWRRMDEWIAQQRSEVSPDQKL